MDIEERAKNMFQEQQRLVGEMKKVIADVAGIGVLDFDHTRRYMNQELVPQRRNLYNQYEEIKGQVDEQMREKLNGGYAELDFYVGRVIEIVDHLNPNLVMEAIKWYRRAYQRNPKKEYLEAAENAERGVAQILTHPWGLRDKNLG